MLEQGQGTMIGPAEQHELALVRASRTGSREAFDRLVERYQRRAVGVAARLLGNTHDANDVAQSAFERAFRHIGNLDDERRFGAWLLRIVTNLALNHRRDRAVERRRQNLGDRRGAEAPLDEIASGSASPEAELAALELSDLLRAVIESLPDRQRTALLLFAVESLPQQTVAAIMGCSVGAVKWHVFQARRLLRDRLDAMLGTKPDTEPSSGRPSYPQAAVSDGKRKAR